LRLAHVFQEVLRHDLHWYLRCLRFLAPLCADGVIRYEYSGERPLRLQSGTNGIGPLDEKQACSRRPLAACSERTSLHRGCCREVMIAGLGSR
jgi:hypothetical protein